MMSAADATRLGSGRSLTTVLGARAIRDLELALLGVLPPEQVLGAAIGSRVSPGLTGLPLEDPVDDVDTLLLVDEEQTPLAALESPLAVEPGLVAGRLVALRRRESGRGRDRALTHDDLAHPWSKIVVLSRPLAAGERLEQHGSDVLLLVPDDRTGTDGIPVLSMLTLADHAAARLGGATVRTVPLSWRDPVSDESLTAALGAVFTAYAEPATITVLRADDGTSAGAGWSRLRSRLDEAGDPIALARELLAPEDVEVVERWRPPRSRRGLVVMFTGLSGSGKSTIARVLVQRISHETARTVSLLDGDVVRQLISSGLGFDRESRLVNLRRIGWIAAEVARHGGIAVCAPIAPYAEIRQELREMAEANGDFLLVHVSTPLEECERRDLKGLYAKARAGLVTEFTGISDPYEVPDDADLSIDTTDVSVEEATQTVLDHLRAGGWLTTGADRAH